ncbi:hypothetical protein FRC05_006925 [Tulasnella sp. 425]|nr:hypothetical protein FRC05_006925 [Tulasnella sp. 425]
MNPATPATVEFVVDILLQSIRDENKDALEAMSKLGDPNIGDEMLGQVDGYAGAIKSTLDDVQRRLLDKMAALHTEHNRMIPLHRLPIEIFVQIITGALEAFRTHCWSGQTHLGRLAILCRVCKRWKDVIGSTPSLWATIDIRDPAAITSAAISRSSNHPLNIIGAPSSGPPKYWGSPPVGWKQFENTAIMHSTRWRSIQLVVASSEDAQALVNAPAPGLQSLEVKSMTECRVVFRRGGSMFEEAGPRLRRLALHGLAIPWRECTLRDLRYLSISGLDEFAPSCGEILGVLRMCHALVEMDLSLRPAATVEPINKERPFPLTQLHSMSFRPLSPSWTSVLLETIRTPSVRRVSLDLDFSGAEYLFPSVIKRARTLFSTIIDTPYQLEISVYPAHLDWVCYPSERSGGDWRLDITARNRPASELLEAVLPEKNANRFALDSVTIDFDGLGRSEFSAALQKLDGVERMLDFGASCCGLEPLFTYMTGATKAHDWGLPELEKLFIYDCDYDAAQLLDMVLTRYGGEESDTSDRGDRPPPLQRMSIHHAPGEADEETLGLVEDIVGHGCFMLGDDVER